MILYNLITKDMFIDICDKMTLVEMLKMNFICKRWRDWIHSPAGVSLIANKIEYEPLDFCNKYYENIQTDRTGYKHTCGGWTDCENSCWQNSLERYKNLLIKVCKNSIKDQKCLTYSKTVSMEKLKNNKDDTLNFFNKIYISGLENTEIVVIKSYDTIIYNQIPNIYKTVNGDVYSEIIFADRPMKIDIDDLNISIKKHNLKKLQKINNENIFIKMYTHHSPNHSMHYQVSYKNKFVILDKDYIQVPYHDGSEN